jgi:hypothetical protein
VIRIFQIGQDELKVLFPDEYDMDRTIYVYSITGQEILKLNADNQQSARIVNVQSLTSGIYFLKAGNQVKKFIR